MKITKLLYFLLILLFSCHSKSSKEIFGDWNLDSSSTPNGKMLKAYESLRMSFYKNGKFSYTRKRNDTIDNYKGEYFISEDTVRKLKAIMLVTDTFKTDPNVFRKYFVYHILELGLNRLITTERTVYKTQDSSIHFDRIDIFKRE